ncbi:enolase C-terminal domain-like protein [Streptomyces sp. CCNWLW230]|uniref:enolase C-terminal domain-like protein n=1 Tax=unclassified Streptomyces TaxID=2593676 RepID=UPI00307863C5
MAELATAELLRPWRSSPPCGSGSATTCRSWWRCTADSCRPQRCGITGLHKLAGWTAAYDRLLAPHNVCGPVGTAATLHLCAATPGVKVLEHSNDFADPYVSELIDTGPDVDPADGCFTVDDRPSTTAPPGTDLDRAACRAGQERPALALDDRIAMDVSHLRLPGRGTASPGCRRGSPPAP